MSVENTPKVYRWEEVSNTLIQLGDTLIADQQVGCLIMAGGQGSRLGFDGPKGLFPIRGKTLFDLHLSKQRGPIAIMTSPQNDAQTRAALPPLDFFVQEELPFLDDEKRPLPVKGPAGNGGLLRLFTQSGLWTKWWDRGVRYLTIIPVDNVLADPFDSALIGMVAQGHDIVVKAVERLPGEKVGVIVLKSGLRVVEYSESPPDAQYANISCFGLTMDFGHRTERLPIHLARKQIEGVWAWKQEEFIFDILPFAKNPAVVVYPRDKCFAPVKTPDDVAAIQRGEVG